MNRVIFVDDKIEIVFVVVGTSLGYTEVGMYNSNNKVVVVDAVYKTCRAKINGR